MAIPSSIRFELVPSRLQLAAGTAALLAAAASILSCQAPPLLTTACLAALGVVGARALLDLWYGRRRALQGLEWRGGDRWRLWRADGRCTEARLHPRSRRAGSAVLLVFRRGVFGRWDRPWILLLPHMVSDAAAARRLRVLFTLEGRRLRGLPQS